MIRIIKFLVYSPALLVATGINYQTATYKLTLLKQANAHEYSIVDHATHQQLDCLAKNIYYEAGHESFAGKVAVAQVTINRAESGNFPRDICQVVYQKTVFHDRVLCQFSWYCDSTKLKKPMNGPVYTESMIVARKVLLEGVRLYLVREALYFHGDYINPGWRLQRVAKIGRHVFYK
jgi:spore germination cell wall hydrolase CwlJ-like protein